MADVVLYEVKDAVATVTINRPDRMNALTTEVLEKLPEALRRAAADRDVRCVVLTGAGDRAFSAGADLAFPGERSPIGHDTTLEDSIGRHGTEAEQSRRGYERAADSDRAALLAFLRSL